MSVPRTVAEVIREYLTLEVKGIDRIYRNVYQPKLQHDRGVVTFFRFHRKQPAVSWALMEPMSSVFIENIEVFAQENDVPLFSFDKDARKDDVAATYRARFAASEGVLFIGKAQEKVSVFRTEKRTNPDTGKKYPWIVKSTAMVNQFYSYCVHEDFVPFFLKFSSYFPYNAKLCLNSHEYVRRQLLKAGIPFEPLDNGILSCAEPQRLQPIWAGLSAAKIDALLRKWLARLPHPFRAADRAAGYRYDVSTVQAEFSLTQVLDRPLSGRIFFEEVIRENLDLGRPDRVQLIFGFRVSKCTAGRFRTRVLTHGVTAPLQVDYKRTAIKQYHKEGLALHTETTINNPLAFGIGKRLENLPALREIGFQANRRLLHVQCTSHDCRIGEDPFRQVNDTLVVNGQRASALRFADRTVQALFSALLVFRLLPRGFSNRELRDHLRPLLGKQAQSMTQGQMTYHLCRLRLHGVIERIPKTHRYRVTNSGWGTAPFCTRCFNRLLRAGLAHIIPDDAVQDSPLRRRFDQLDAAIDRLIEEGKMRA